jgi:dTDP-4-dehydrorhamnose reductase
MKILVTGVSGLLGLNLALQLRSRAIVSGVYHAHPIWIDGVETRAADVCSAAAVDALVSAFRPDAIVHTAGLTSVDACERDPARAARLNVDAARIAAEAAARCGAHLIHISTDQLFDGSRPFVDETAAPAPLNVYGRSKRDAERAVVQACPAVTIVRTNFFGWGTSIRRSFSDWIVDALDRGDQLDMFTDAWFTPILVNDLIERLLLLVERGPAGIIHIAGAERLTKHGFALQLAATLGYSPDRIAGRPLQTFGLPARRPLDMSLSTEKARRLFGAPMPGVAAALEGLRGLRDNGWPRQLEAALVNAPAA